MEIFELLPLALIILWSVIGAKGAKKKQEEKRRRAEADRRAREGQQRARLESGESDGRLTIEAETSSRPPRTVDAGTAVDMVPDELWSILTGGAPPPTRPRAPEPYPEDSESSTVPEGGWATSPPWDEEDAVNSVEGVSAEEIGDEVVDYDEAADATARARYERPRRFTWEDTNPETARAAAIETDEIRHVEFHDQLRASEIGGAGKAAAPRARERLGIESLEEVRRAIVLMEVLGPPKALQ